MHIIKRAADPTMVKLNFEGVDYYIRVNAQKRRSFRLRINADYELELLAPPLSSYQIHQFLNDHQGWLFEQVHLHLDELKMKTQVYRFEGKAKPIQKKATKSIDEKVDVLWVSDAWDNNQLIKKVSEYKRQQAYALAHQRLNHWWSHFSYNMGLPTLRIKNMHTRWGSLSSKHSLNLSLELFSYPLEQIDLVLVHELCHIKHMNHSADFYALMQSVLPDWKAREAKLKHPVA